MGNDLGRLNITISETHLKPQSQESVITGADTKKQADGQERLVCSFVRSVCSFVMRDIAPKMSGANLIMQTTECEEQPSEEHPKCVADYQQLVDSPDSETLACDDLSICAM